MSGQKSSKPWWREPWPWALISLPAIAVVAGFYTLWLAVKNPDTEVDADKVVKRGLAVVKVDDASQTPPSAQHQGETR